MSSKKKVCTPAAPEIRMCVDMYPPAEQLQMFAELAKVEDPTNVIVGLDQVITSGDMLPRKIAFVTAKKWANGRTLRVAFMGGTAAQKNHVKQVVPELERFANIKFAFDADPGQSEIRVAFASGQGTYSYIGTDALGIPRNTPTLNLGWIDPGTTLHEFCHALGAIHEHQHPQAGIPWDREAVYRYYSGPPNYWDRATIDNNIFGKYAQTITQFSAYDKLSIMHYPIDRALVTDPNFAVGWNRVLSAQDKTYLGEVYPGIQTPPPPPPPPAGKRRITLETDGTLAGTSILSVQ